MSTIQFLTGDDEVLVGLENRGMSGRTTCNGRTISIGAGNSAGHGGSDSIKVK